MIDRAPKRGVHDHAIRATLDKGARSSRFGLRDCVNGGLREKSRPQSKRGLRDAEWIALERKRPQGKVGEADVEFKALRDCRLPRSTPKVARDTDHHTVDVLPAVTNRWTLLTNQPADLPQRRRLDSVAASPRYDTAQDEAVPPTKHADTDQGALLRTLTKVPLRTLDWWVADTRLVGCGH